MIFKKIKPIFLIFIIPFFLLLFISNSNSQDHNIDSYFDIPIKKSKKASYSKSGYLWGLWAYCAPASDFVIGNKIADLYYFLPHFNGPTYEEFAKGALNFEETNTWSYGTSGCNDHSLKIAETNLEEFIKNLFFDLGMPDDQLQLDDIDKLRIILLKRRTDDNEFKWYIQKFKSIAVSIRKEEEMTKESEKLKEQEKIENEKRKEEEKIQNEKKLVSETIIKNNSGLLQSSLKSLGFYNGPIDNDFGKASLSALMKWKVSNGLEENNIISQDEFDLLKKQALANKSDTSKTTDEINEKNIAQDEKSQKLSDELLFAKQFIEDLINFQKINPDSLDIIQLSNLIVSNKDILNNAWNEIIESDFEKLREFVIKNEQFIIYREQQEKIRKKDELNIIAEINNKIEKNSQFLENFLRDNITSDLVPEILSFIQKLKEVRSSQKLNKMNSLITELDDFYQKNSLQKNYLAFEDKSKVEPKDPVVENINEIPLIEFDFIKNSNNDDFISLVNLSGSSPNALINLEGDIVFENDTALSCFYQSRKVDKKKKFYIIDNISDKKFIIKVLDDECDRANLLKYDILIFKKDDLIKETQSYVSSLVSEVGNSNFREFKIISEKKFEEELIRRDIISKQTKEDIINQTKMGFGALVIDNNSTVLCSDLMTNQKGHKSIINLLDNEFQRMAYDKSISEVNFDDIEQTFTNIQRGKCGFVYSSETSLSKILNGLNNTNTNYEVLPIWYSENEVLVEQERIENAENVKIIEIQKTKEEIEKQKELEKNRLEAEGITKKQLQEELQAKSANVVNYFIETIEKESEKLFDLETMKESWLSDAYPDMRQFIEDRLKESWELNEISATIYDYGLADFRNRRIETFIFDINSKIMNRDIGEYQDNCFRLAVILDAEFDRKREPEINNCSEGSMNFYKKRINFSSEWLVQ